MSDREFLASCIGCDWDDGSIQTNWEKHHAFLEEAEDVFFSNPHVVRADVSYSQREKRHFAPSQTSRGRRLIVAFTIRRNLIRIISAHDMNRSEKLIYARHENEAT